MSAKEDCLNEEEDDIITIGELAEYDARNLTGCDSDISCCTFPKGYVYRQALYLCITCMKRSGGNTGAAVCYPCSLQCHGDHELLDLYTKRNIRCDCGNNKFPEDMKCKLWEEKDDINIKNKYNHNFCEEFCVCGSHYGTSEDDMHQCNICEDWYHLKHLSEQPEELTSPYGNDIIDSASEFTCKLCLNKHDFLHRYNRAFLNDLMKEANRDNSGGGVASCSLGTLEEAPLSATSQHRRELSCGAFWPEDWRHCLCHCALCKKMMASLGVAFLLEERDTIGYYYKQAKHSLCDGKVEEDEMKEVLSELPHEQAMAVAEGFAILKRELSEFFRHHDPAQVVTSADVYALFDKLKRRRLDEHD